MRKMKKGVSLVTVLLFMMVATIAATATYKWLSSIGSSSAARLQMNEARQAALSGIEAARSWMTYNGNDLGAVVKQYFEGGKKPILLNSVLPRMKSGKMLDSVWLMGVNAESSLRYKIKIVSQGTTRENVKYSEVAIFNVAGLYQAEIPSETRDVNYKDAFHGSLATADVINVQEGGAFIKNTPAVKNAKGQALNTIFVKDYLVWDGDFYVNNGANIGNLYVTGDLSFLGGDSKPFNINNNLYVGGKVYGTSTASKMIVGGSAYLNGGMKVNDRSPTVIHNGLCTSCSPTGGKFDFYGNVTSNGDIDHFNAGASASYIDMHQHLVLNGKLVFPASASSYDYWFRVERNAFIRDNSTASGNIGTGYIPKTWFGTNVDDSLYLDQFMVHNGANDCGSLFNCAKSTNGNIYVAYKGRLISTPLPEQYKEWNADSMTAYRDMFSEEREDCGSFNVSKGKLQFNEDILSMVSTSGVPLVHSADKRNGCDEKIWEDNNDSPVPVEALNSCYNIANGSNLLVDKSWLVVSWDHAPVWNPSSEKLSGNFVFIINSTSAPTGELELPETAVDARVLIYLPNGWKNTASGNSLKTNSSSKAVSNYFIYSADDIGGFNMQKSSLNGSIYMEGCSQLNTLGDINTLAVNFNAPLFRGLVKSLILCEYDGSHSCAPHTGVESGFADIDPYQTMDSYYVATSPQLIVEVESQYRNNEPLPQTDRDYGTVASSEVVLPRIIYLPRDAKGRFSDYYNVIGLNGLKTSKKPASMQCKGPGTIPTGESMLTSSGSELKEGKYVCYYGDKGTTVPVFVIVEGSLSENAVVQFHDYDVEKKIIPGGNTNVRLVATESDMPMTVTIRVDLPSAGGWLVEPIHPNLVNNGDGTYSLTTTSSGENVSIPVFKVSSELENAAAGVFFNITGCQKCIPGANQQAHVFTKDIATVERKNINCSEIDENEFKQMYGIECSKLGDVPSCGSLVNVSQTTWVTAHGLGCVPIEGFRNQKWECRIGGSEVELKSALSGDALCTAYIPPMSVQLKRSDTTYMLPAELKRKRNTVVVKRMGTTNGSVNVEYKRLEGSIVFSSSSSCSEDICTYDLYAGDSVYFSKGSGNFSYWTCDGKSCGDFKNKQINTSSFKIPLLGGVDTVTAWFDQKDEHCFYTSFEEFKKIDNGWCANEDESKCIDKCKAGKKHCSVNNNDHQYNNADWVMVYSNNGDDFVFPAFSDNSIKTPSSYIYEKVATLYRVEQICLFGHCNDIKLPYRGFEKKGNASVLLNTAKAGSNGLMTVLLNVPNSKDKLKNLGAEILSLFQNETLLLDYGLIVRSTANGSEYFTVNVVNDGGVVFARVCLVQNQNYDDDLCRDVNFEFEFESISWSNFKLESYPLTLNIDVNGDEIDITMSQYFGTTFLGTFLFGNKEWGSVRANINLQDEFGTSLLDVSHQYVGINLGHPYKGDFATIEYSVRDIGWRSFDYDESCWDTPKISCSFKSNYVGGFVPDSMDVTPWVGKSSWFDEKNCKAVFYYNGCDVQSSKFDKMIPKNTTYHDVLPVAYALDILHLFGNEVVCPSDGNGLGLYNFSVRELRKYGDYGRLNSEYFWFEKEGYHGYPKEDNRGKGVLNEASVVVLCEQDVSGNGIHVYDASCGEFVVGEFEHCSESYSDMLTQSSGYCHEGSCLVNLDADNYNVREATISLKIAAPVSTEFKAYLVDADGFTSSLTEFKQTEDVSIFKVDVESVSDAPGFNPQKLSAILFKDFTYSFTVQQVWSSCPYEFDISCDNAEYNLSDTSWRVSATVLNPERAQGGCEMILIRDDSEVSGTRVYSQCGENLVLDFKHEIYGQSLTHNYAFKVLARDENGDVLGECSTQKVEVQPLEIECRLSGSSDKPIVMQGNGVPHFEFKVNNCPPDYCSYTITYPSQFGLPPETDFIVSGWNQIPPSSGVNTPDNKLPKRDDYTYNLDVMGHACPGGNEFEVVGEPAKGTCSNQQIVPREDGEYFEADVTFEDGGYWNGTILDSVTVVYTDPLGNVMNVKTEKNEKGSQTYKFKKEVTVSHKLPAGMSTCNQGVCNYVVNFKMDNNCSVKWTTRSIKSMNTSGCLATAITGQDPSNAISFTPLISGCEDGGCSWTLTGASQPFGGSGYNGTDTLTFSDPGAAGTKTYQFRVFPTDSKELSSEPQSCDFSVTYKLEATQVQNSSCYFTSNEIVWGDTATYSFTTNCASCNYSFKSATNAGISSGTTSATAGEATVTLPFKVSKEEPFVLTINGKKINECTETPTFKKIVPNCSVDKSALYNNEKTTFRASFDICKEGSGCNWTWKLMKNQGNSTSETSSRVNSGEVNSKNDIAQEITGGGTYTLYINDREECVVFVTDKGNAPNSSVDNCHFESDPYSYGANNVKFIVGSVTAYNESWTVKKGNTTVAFGSNLSKNGAQFEIPFANFTANSGTSGTYVFKMINSETNRENSCTASLNVNTPTVTCTKTCDKGYNGKCKSSPNYRLIVQATGCEYGCNYTVNWTEWGLSKATKSASINNSSSVTINKVGNNQTINSGSKIAKSTSYSIIMNGNISKECQKDY